MFDVTNKTKSKPPVSGLLFEQMKKKVLGENYSLSLVFCDDSLSRKLNLQYRDKNKPTNILSFPLDKKSGEIFLNLSIIKKQAKTRGVKDTDYLIYLFIHGLLHLDGFEHGHAMTNKEKFWLKKFEIPEEVL